MFLHRYATAFFVFFTSNLVLTLFASMITALIAPAAAGSGIPEVKAYLNGVDAPGIFSLRTLAVKVLIWEFVSQKLFVFMLTLTGNDHHGFNFNKSEIRL